MNILHINTLQTGGAALCAQRICKVLIQNGINSRMLIAKGEANDYTEIANPDPTEPDPWYSNPIKGKLKHLLMHTPWFWDKEKIELELQKAIKESTIHPYIHLPFSEYKNVTEHPLIKWADIIHLHWVAGMLDYPSFFKNVQKPIVWTLHDKHPAIGLMHYNSFLFHLPTSYQTIDKKCVKIKKDAVQRNRNKIHLVAISQQMVSICKDSPILKNVTINHIPNGVDVNIFKPYKKNESRKKLEIPIEATVFLFSAYNIWDDQKGLNRTIRALEKLCLKNTYLICIGANDGKKIQNKSLNIILTNTINDQTELAKFYSASDFFCLSSFEETFAQTPLEAMACGTPVISTPCSGAPDLIRQFNGVLCSGFNDEDIAKGIKEALTYQNTQGYSISKIRNYIVNNYSYDIIAKQYIDLYNSILNN